VVGVVMDRNAEKLGQPALAPSHGTKLPLMAP
jgi:hypothetical protein